MTDYPENFRKPDWEGRTYLVRMGVIRSAGSGYVDQRRTNRLQAEQVPAQFVIPSADLTAWLQWWDANAYGWFNMPLQNAASSPDDCAMARVRCTGDVQITASSAFGWWIVQTEIEAVI